MTTHAVKRRHTRRRRPLRRRRGPGFWSGLRHQTHTDHLRHRIGGAAGRAIIRRINRNRARRGKPPIPPRGGDWYTLPSGNRRVAGKPVRPSRIVPGSPVVPKATPAPKPSKVSVPKPTAVTTPKATPKAPVTPRTKGQPPVFSGPYVKASKGKVSTRKVTPGSVSVTTSGISGPGNRGAGPGVGVPAYGTGGAAGDGDHMISPGSAGGSATGGAPMGPSGTASPPPRPTTTQPTTPGADGTNRSGGSTVSQPTGSIETLSETPETDAEYVAALRGLSDDVRGWGERIEEIQASLLEVVGMDQAALPAYTAMAEAAAALADATQQAVIDFLNTYQGVIETAQSGVKIPGGEGRFFTGDVA